MSQVLSESNSSNTIQNYYVYGHGLISRITPAGERYCYHFDSRGSTIAITDDAGNVVNSYIYDEFGQVLAENETYTNQFKYVGQYGVIDEGNGLLFMRARYYDTATGKFLSKDPSGFGGGDLNLYSYVGGNPVIGIDPEGKSLLGIDSWLYQHTSWADDSISVIKKIWGKAGGAMLSLPGEAYKTGKEIINSEWVADNSGSIIYDYYLKNGNYTQEIDDDLASLQKIFENVANASDMAFSIVSLFKSGDELVTKAKCFSKYGRALKTTKSQVEYALKFGRTWNQLGWDTATTIVDSIELSRDY